MKLQAFRLATLSQRGSNAHASCEYCKIFKNIYFEEHLFASGVKAPELVVPGPSSEPWPP